MDWTLGRSQLGWYVRKFKGKSEIAGKDQAQPTFPPIDENRGFLFTHPFVKKWGWGKLKRANPPN